MPAGIFMTGGSCQTSYAPGHGGVSILRLANRFSSSFLKPQPDSSTFTSASREPDASLRTIFVAASIAGLSHQSSPSDPL